MRWFALTVKPQHEKSVAACLTAKSLEAFVPTYRERRRWSDRIRTIELPLFARYVFCRYSFEDRLAVIGTPSVLSVVSFNGKAEPIPDEQIEAIRTMVGSGMPVSPWNYAGVGQRVCIDGGPLSGVEGILIREKTALRVVVNVELLQRAVAVEIDRDCLRALDRARAPWAQTCLPADAAVSSY